MTTPESVASPAKAWLMATHPGPSLLVSGLTAVFAASVGLAWWQVVLVWLAMLANQAGIGLGNDWLDARGDLEAGRSDKPVATGVLTPSQVLAASIVAGGVALALSGALGWWAAACQVVMLAAGWWYNAHAKHHWSSVLAYLIGFGLLPVFPVLANSPVTTATLPTPWVIAVAGLLGVSAHFANALPDIASDRITGSRGLPQILGPRASAVAMVVGVVAVTIVISTQANFLPIWFRAAVAALAVGISLFAAWLAFRPTPPRAIFPVVMAVAALSVAAIAWEFALSS